MERPVRGVSALFLSVRALRGAWFGKVVYDGTLRFWGLYLLTKNNKRKMKTKLLITILFSLLLFSCNTKSASEESSRTKTPEELKAELKQNEQNNPKQYLEASGKWGENNVKIKEAGLFADAEYQQDGYNVNGTIKNNASVAIFKDVVLRLSYLSQTQSVISSEDYTVYKYVEPNHSVEFDLTVHPPDAFVKMQIDVVSGVPTESTNASN